MLRQSQRETQHTMTAPKMAEAAMAWHGFPATSAAARLFTTTTSMRVIPMAVMPVRFYSPELYSPIICLYPKR